MRVITIQEPWASLIGEKIKTIETRTWPCKQRGELYIHAGATKISSSDEKKKQLLQLLQGPLHYGSIFVKCDLTDFILITDEYAKFIQQTQPQCFLCGDFSPGRYAWILMNIQQIEPIKKVGKLGIWYC